MNAEITKTLLNAIVELLDPLVEVVIHDLTNNKISYINGKLSQREIGQDSLLDVNLIKKNGFEKYIYGKSSIDGRQIKSISIQIENNTLICLNCDISVFHSMRSLSDIFLKLPPKQKEHDSLFTMDWQEKLHHIIDDYLCEQGWRFETLSMIQKKLLLQLLYKAGAFEQKKSSDYIAKTLSISRATIFKYLKEWKKCI